MEFAISSWSFNEAGSLECLRITLDSILAGFAKANQPVPCYLTKFQHDGVRYSFEDFDTLASALRDLRKIGITERDLDFEVV